MGGVAGAVARARVLRAARDLSFSDAPGGTPQPLPSGLTHKGADGGAALTGQSGLQAPAGGRAGGQEGAGRLSAREGACVCVCPCMCLRARVCDGGRAELCASACAGASVGRSVRLKLRTALRARALARSPSRARFSCGVPGAAAGSARHPRPRLRPAPGYCAELRGVGRVGAGALRRCPRPQAGGSLTFGLQSPRRRPPPAASQPARSPRRPRPTPRWPGQGGRGSRSAACVHS